MAAWAGGRRGGTLGGGRRAAAGGGERGPARDGGGPPDPPAVHGAPAGGAPAARHRSGGRRHIGGRPGGGPVSRREGWPVGGRTTLAQLARRRSSRPFWARRPSTRRADASPSLGRAGRRRKSHLRSIGGAILCLCELHCACVRAQDQIGVCNGLKSGLVDAAVRTAKVQLVVFGEDPRESAAVLAPRLLFLGMDSHENRFCPARRGGADSDGLEAPLGLSRGQRSSKGSKARRKRSRGRSNEARLLVTLASREPPAAFLRPPS